MDLRNPGIVQIHVIFNPINPYQGMFNYNELKAVTGTQVVSATPEPGRAVERTHR